MKPTLTHYVLRSMSSHQQSFISMADGWPLLPEPVAERRDHLRRFGRSMTGRRQSCFFLLAGWGILFVPQPTLQGLVRSSAWGALEGQSLAWLSFSKPRCLGDSGYLHSTGWDTVLYSVHSWLADSGSRKHGFMVDGHKSRLPASGSSSC